MSADESTEDTISNDYLFGYYCYALDTQVVEIQCLTGLMLVFFYFYFFFAVGQVIFEFFLA